MIKSGLMWQQKVVKDGTVGVGVSAVVFEKDKVLLIKREDLDYWSFPGGGVEPNESLEEAVKRETLEETGIKIEPQKLTGVYLRRIPYLNVNFIFKAVPVGGKLDKRSSETLEVAWVPIKESAGYFNSPFYLQRIEDAQNPRNEVIFRHQEKHHLGILLKWSWLIFKRKLKKI